MPTDVVSTTFAGLDGIYVSFVNSIGVMNGFANISASGGSGMRKLKGAQKLPSALPPINRKYIKGDDRVIDSYIFQADTLPGGNVEVGTNDLTLDAAAQGSTTWTLGNWLMGIYGISAPTFPQLIALGHQQAHSQDSGSVGAPGFNNILIPDIQMLPLAGDDPTHSTEGKNLYGCTFIPFSIFPTGAPLDNTNFSVLDGIMVKWWSKYRTFFYGFIGDGAATSITVDHTPVDAASTKVFATPLAGGSTAAVTVASATPSTKVISVSPTVLAADHIYVVMYESSKL